MNQLPLFNFVRFALRAYRRTTVRNNITSLPVEQHDALESVQVFAAENAVDIPYQKARGMGAL